MEHFIKIVKIGGNVINDDDKLDAFLKAFSRLDGDKLLVHGGGNIASKLAQSLDIPVQIKDGRRITGDQMIDVVVMAYAGLVNKKIVAKLQALKIDAIGLSGADGKLITSRKRPVKNGIDYGWVGDPIQFNINLLTGMFEESLVPVVCPITISEESELLNTNADTVASELAVALSENYTPELNFCFELKGVYRDLNDHKSLIKNINYQIYQEEKKAKNISDGMIPKLDNAFEAIRRGVKAVRILHYSAINKISDPNFHEYTYLH